LPTPGGENYQLMLAVGRKLPLNELLLQLEEKGNTNIK
jgi:hypothetical protein